MFIACVRADSERVTYAGVVVVSRAQLRGYKTDTGFSGGNHPKVLAAPKPESQLLTYYEPV